MPLARRRLLLVAGLAVTATALGGGAWYNFGQDAPDGAVFTADGLAIRGYDPVAYVTDGKPVEGIPEHSLAWNGATWRFASAEHRERFEADPERYAPAYGGYCAWAVGAKGEAYPIDPTAWKIVDGRLYLNYSHDVQADWNEDIPGFIAKGDDKWPGLRRRLEGAS